MSYVGKRRGSRKVLSTVRIVHDGSGQAQMSLNGGALGGLVDLDLTTWFEIFDSSAMNETVNLIEVFDSTGEVMQIGTGGTDGAGNAAAATLMQVTPGGNGTLYVRIDAATRLSMKALSSVPTANTETLINFYD
jgi:hypothetical protein